MNIFTTSRALALLATLAIAPVALAVPLTIYPAGAGPSVAGNSTTGAPGFGTGSFQESSNAKGEIYITSTSLFGRQVSFGEITSVSYWTNKPGTSASVDWSFYIYTAKVAGDASFYHTRLTSEPLYSNAAPVAANTWHQWTSGGTAPMRFYDQARDGGIQGTNSDPTFAMLEAGPVTWPSSQTTVDYRNELVNYFSLQTGSDWSAGFMGLVDGLTITLRDGSVGSVNFEAAPAAVTVPEPASLALLGIGAAGLLAAAKRRKRVA